MEFQTIEYWLIGLEGSGRLRRLIEVVASVHLRILGFLVVAIVAVIALVVQENFLLNYIIKLIYIYNFRI